MADNSKDLARIRQFLSPRRIIGAATVACLIVMVVVVALSASNSLVYARHQKAGGDLIASLENHRPKDVSVKEWGCATFWMGIAFANVCYSPGHVTLSELKQLNDDLGTKLQGSVDMQTVDWIWQRLAATGPHGAQYSAQFEPRYQAELAEIRRRERPVP